MCNCYLMPFLMASGEGAGLPGRATVIDPNQCGAAKPGSALTPDPPANPP